MSQKSKLAKLSFFECEFEIHEDAERCFDVQKLPTVMKFATNKILSCIDP